MNKYNIWFDISGHGFILLVVLMVLVINLNRLNRFLLHTTSLISAQKCTFNYFVEITKCLRGFEFDRLGPGGVEPPTSGLSDLRSNHLSYDPLNILTL